MHGISPVLQCPTDSVGHVGQPLTGSYWYEPPKTTGQGQGEITTEHDKNTTEDFPFGLTDKQLTIFTLKATVQHHQ